MYRRLRKLAYFLDADRADAPLSARFIEGALFGLVFFGVFTPLLLVGWVFGGREATIRGIETRLDLLTLLYPLGAIVSCSLLYGLTSLVRSRPARALLGTVAFLPWFAALALCMDGGHTHWRILHTLTTVVGAVAFGAPFGWDMTQPRIRRRASRSRRSAV